MTVSPDRIIPTVTVEEGEPEHTRLSPSSAHRWMSCPGSVAAESAYPDRSSPDAAVGTVFHDLVAKCIEFDLDPYSFLGETWVADGTNVEIDKDMVGYAVAGIDRLRELEGEVYVEHRVDLGAWLPGQAGTLDIGIINDTWIGIWDWKYGIGVPVYPEENEQLMLYALGFWENVARHKTDAKEFRLFIEQPRIPGAGGMWSVSLEDLLKFGERAAEAGQRTEDPNAPREAGLKPCLFCKAKVDCVEFDRFNLDLMCLKFEDLDSEDAPELPDPEGLTPERRSYLVRHRSMFEKFMANVYNAVQAHALAGYPTPGLKVVLGNKGPRKWADEAKAEALLKRGLGVRKSYVQKLKSPTQAEKELGTRLWKEAEKLIVRDEPKPVLVPENDRRPALEPVTEMFDDLDADSGSVDALI